MSNTLQSQAVRTGEYELNEFGRVVWSKIVLWRNVVNDAVVGPWMEFDMAGFDMTVEGLKAWMRKENRELVKGAGVEWDETQLTKGLAFSRGDGHIYDYGQRIQFWVPKPDEESNPDEDEKKMKLWKPAPGELFKVRRTLICADASGRALTLGKSYEGTFVDNEFFRTKDDEGVEQDFMVERFKGALNVTVHRHLPK